jgi:large subunit ribosomal protein L16
MGKGKAPVEGWVAVVKPGRVLFEMAGPAEELAKEAMKLAIFKLPIKCKFVTKRDFEAIPTTIEAEESAE